MGTVTLHVSGTIYYITLFSCFSPFAVKEKWTKLQKNKVMKSRLHIKSSPQLGRKSTFLCAKHSILPAKVPETEQFLFTEFWFLGEILGIAVNSYFAFQHVSILYRQY